MSHLLEGILGLPPLLVLALVFLFPALEASIFVGVVVPDPVQLAALVHRVLKDKVDPTDFKKLDSYVKDPRIVDAALTELDKELNVRKLKGYVFPYLLTAICGLNEACAAIASRGSSASTSRWTHSLWRTAA